MDLNRFAQCCAAYGAERRRWPESDQPLYDQHAATPQGAVLLAESERADRFLDVLEAPEPDHALERRISALAQPAWRRFAKPVAAMAASMALGFVLGFVQIQQRAADVGAAAQWLLGPQSLQEIEL